MEAFDKNNKNLDENFCLLPTEALMQSCSSIKLKSIRAVKKKITNDWHSPRFQN